MITCAECREQLLRLDFGGAGTTTPAEREAVEEHLRHCTACPREAALLREGEIALRNDLAAERSAATPTEWAAAVRRARHRRLGWMVGVPLAAIVLTALIWLGARAGSGIIRDVDADFGALEVETFTLSCLSPEQAERLLRPYMPNERSNAWGVGQGIRAVTVRAPRETLDRVPRILARFEKDPGAACHALP